MLNSCKYSKIRGRNKIGLNCEKSRFGGINQIMVNSCKQSKIRGRNKIGFNCENSRLGGRNQIMQIVEIRRQKPDYVKLLKIVDIRQQKQDRVKLFCWRVEGVCLSFQIYVRSYVWLYAHSKILYSRIFCTKKSH